MIEKALGPVKPTSAPTGLTILFNQLTSSMMCRFLATSCCPKHMLLNQKSSLPPPYTPSRTFLPLLLPF